MRYPWARLNGVIFESVAFDYVRTKFPDQDWAMLPLSGDGNRDIEARSPHCFLGSSVNLASWVEAKYTLSFTRALGKGRLDPTLVSALIEPNLGAVMFISNGFFNASYIGRAERALRVRHLPTPPQFVDGTILEGWLDGVPEIVRKYFGSRFRKKQPSSIAALHIQECQMVGLDDYRSGHLEGRKTLTAQETFVVQFLIATTVPRTIALQFDCPSLSPVVSREFPETIKVGEGLSTVCFLLQAHRPVRRGRFSATLRDLKTQNSACCSVLFSISAEPPRIRYARQLKAMQSLGERLRNHQQMPFPHAIHLVGEAAAGKTWLLSQLISQLPLDLPIRRYAFMEHAPAHNAQTLCRSLLFMTFGNVCELDGLEHALGRQLRTDDISQDLVRWLLCAARSPHAALEIIHRLLKNDLLGPFFTQYARGDAKILILDDVHKCDSDTMDLLARLLRQLAASDNKTLIVLATRPQLRSDLGSALVESAVDTIEIGGVTDDDILETVSELVGQRRASMLLQHIGSAISSVLELQHLAFELNNRKTELDTLAGAAFVDRCHDIARSVTAVGLVGRLRNQQEELAADLIFIADGGVETGFIRKRFGEAVIEALLEHRVIMREGGEPSMLRPKHDVIREAYLARRNIYSSPLGDLLDDYMSWAPDRRSDLIGHLCRCGGNWHGRYFSEAVEIRNRLISETQFGAARPLAQALYHLAKERGRTAPAISDFHYVESLYAHAECAVHTTSARRSLELMNEVCQEVEHCAPSLELYVFKLQAKAEIFNARFWLLNDENLLQDIDEFLDEWKFMPQQVAAKAGVRTARMNANNRKMMVLYLFDRNRDAERVFETSCALAKETDAEADLGHLLMDKGKALMLADPEQALRLFQSAQRIYQSLKSQRRRLLVCESQMAYIRILLQCGHIAELQDRAEALLRDGYMQEYANALLEIAAVHLVRGDAANAHGVLSGIESNNTALESSRRCFLFNHLMALSATLDRDLIRAEQLNGSYSEAVAKLGRSYSAIAKHNRHRPGAPAVCWGHIRDDRALWVENRIW